MKSKILVLRDNLFSATSKAILFAKKKPILPVEECFKVYIREKSLIIGAYNGETYAEISCPCTVVGDPLEVFLVNAFKMHELVKLSVEPEMSISLKEKGELKLAVISSGRSKHEFPAYPDDMPIMQPGALKFGMQLRGSDLYAMSNTIANLIDDSNELASTAHGINAQYVDEAGALYFWGGSGQRAGAYIIPTNKPQGFESFIIPTKTISNMDKLFDGNEMVDAQVKGGILELEGREAFIQTRLVDIKYPDYYKVIKSFTNRSMVASFSVSELRLSVDKLMLHTTKDFIGMRMTFSEKSAEISIHNEGIMQSGVEVIPYTGCEEFKEHTVSSNLVYLKEILKQTMSDHTTVTTYPKSIMFSSKNNDRTFLFLLAQYSV